MIGGEIVVNVKKDRFCLVLFGETMFSVSDIISFRYLSNS